MIIFNTFQAYIKIVQRDYCKERQQPCCSNRSQKIFESPGLVHDELELGLRCTLPIFLHRGLDLWHLRTVNFYNVCRRTIL